MSSMFAVHPRGPRGESGRHTVVKQCRRRVPGLTAPGISRCVRRVARCIVAREQFEVLRAVARRPIARNYRPTTANAEDPFESLASRLSGPQSLTTWIGNPPPSGVESGFPAITEALPDHDYV